MSNIKLRHENEFKWYGMLRFNYRNQLEFKYSKYEVVSLFLGCIAVFLEVCAGIIINSLHYTSITEIKEAKFQLILFLMFSGFAFSICGFIVDLIDMKNTEAKHTFFMLSLIINTIILMEAVISVFIINL